ncbi:MAG: hypothetical protein WKF48_11690 [Solirubrobacteraceae bacterium]
MVGDLDDPVQADLRSGELGANVGDQLGGLRRRLAQLLELRRLPGISPSDRRG